MLKSLSVEMYLVVNCPMVKHTSGIEAHVDACVYHSKSMLDVTYLFCCFFLMKINIFFFHTIFLNPNTFSKIFSFQLNPKIPYVAPSFVFFSMSNVSTIAKFLATSQTLSIEVSTLVLLIKNSTGAPFPLELPLRNI